MRVGRPTLGAGHVEGLDGTKQEKQRLEAMLLTLSGAITIEEACRRTKLSRSRFFELRSFALQGALEGLAPGVPGRPPKPLYEATDVERLEHENRYLREELQIARLRTEVALVMPEVLRTPSGPGEKRSARAGKRSPRPSPARSGTTRGSAS